MPIPSAMPRPPRSRRVTITAPKSSEAAVTIESLVVAAMNAVSPGVGNTERPFIMGGVLNPGTATMASVTLGDSATSLPVVVAANAKYAQDDCGFLGSTYIKSAADSTTAVVVLVYLTTPVAG